MALPNLILIVICIYLSAPLIESKNHKDYAPVLKTPSGVVEGFVAPCITGKSAHAYLGIPYGQPTSGKLRFQFPQPAKPWKGTLKATSLPYSCPQKPFPLERISKAVRQWQVHTPINEDCLRLSIWTPALTPSRALPVMVWVHGGGFTRGSTSVSMYDGKCLSSEENVIIVTINYRVDSFGYLFLNDSSAPGNMGIYDQQLALKWIRDNIASFGGDPNEVTLFGHSAGSVSVGLHMLAPSSRGLFKRGILESGGPTAKWTYDTKEEAFEKSMSLVRSMGCSTINASVIMSCLQKATVEEVLYHEPAYGYDDIFVFTNIIDGGEGILSDDPNKLMEKHAFENMDIMTGTVQNEGNIFLPGQMPVYFNSMAPKPRITKKNYRDALKELTKLDGESLEAVEFHYNDFTDRDNVIKMSEAIEKVLSDTFFTCSSNKISYHYAEAGNKVFNYFFTHRSSNSLWPKWVGVSHGEEILYIFGIPLDPKNGYSQEEAEFSKRIMKLWSNFAKYGNPAGKDKEFPEWPQYTTSRQEHLILAPNNSTIGHHLRGKACEYWESTRPYKMPPRSPLELLKLFGL